MIGSGDVLYHMTHIEDLVDGIILCGEHPNALGRTYVFGGPRYTTIRELVDTIARVAGVPAPRGHIPVAPVMVAAVLCEGLCKPFRHRAARSFLGGSTFREEPGVLDGEGAARARVQPEGRSRAGRPPNAGVVPRRRLAIAKTTAAHSAREAVSLERVDPPPVTNALPRPRALRRRRGDCPS